MPMTIFISPHLKGSGIRIQTSPLIIKFDLFKTQINNFIIHKYLEETDQTANSCKRNVRIKTYLFSMILYSEGISQFERLLLFHLIWVFLSFIFFAFAGHVCWIGCTFCWIFYNQRRKMPHLHLFPLNHFLILTHLCFHFYQAPEYILFFHSPFFCHRKSQRN